MENLDSRHLMALLSAYAVTIGLLVRTHPAPDALKPAFAAARAQIPEELDQNPALYGVYQATLDTFEREIPSR